MSEAAEKFAAAEVELQKKLSEAEEKFAAAEGEHEKKYAAIAGVANIDLVEKILHENRQEKENQKIVLELHHEAHEAKKVWMEKQRKLKSGVEVLEGIRQVPPDVAAARLASKRTNKPNPQMRKKLKLAAATASAAQSAGNLPTPQHNDLWNSPVLSFDSFGMTSFTP